MFKKLMIMMGVVAFVLLVIFVISNSSPKSSVNEGDVTGILKVAIHNDIPKMGYAKYFDDEIKGLEVDIAKKLAQQIYGSDNLIDLQSTSNKSALFMLENKMVDCVIATQTNINEDYIYSSPYYTDAIDILFKNGNYDSIESLDGTKIGVITNSICKTAVEDLIKGKNIEIEFVDFESYQDGYNAIENGSINGFAMQRVFVNANLKALTIGSCEYHIVFRKSDHELRDKVNSVLDELKNTGELDKMLNDWK